MALSKPLSGLGVLVTRPAGQAESLCERIEAAGGQAIRFPALEIAPVPDTGELRAALAGVGPDGMIIYVSANAARHALLALSEHNQELPAAAPVAVGPASARALRERGVEPALTSPPPYDSEALLGCPAMQAVAEKCILIVRGDGGRPLLGDTLSRRGARVSYAEAYTRCIPVADPDPLLELWSGGGIDAVTVTSSQGLENLRQMIGARGRVLLRRTPLVVLSARTAKLASRLGAGAPVLVSEQASDESILATLESWRADDHRRTRVGAGRG